MNRIPVLPSRNARSKLASASQEPSRSQRRPHLLYLPVQRLRAIDPQIGVLCRWPHERKARRPHRSFVLQAHQFLCPPALFHIALQAALETFSAVRRWNLALLETVAPADFARKLSHPERGEMTFQTIVDTMGGHDLNHLVQLEAIAVQVPLSR